MNKVRNIHARQILDSRGNPTLEVEIQLNDNAFGRAAVPSGASTGEHEAVELRDNGSAYLGKSVYQAVENVNRVIAGKVVGMDAMDIAWLEIIPSHIKQTSDGTYLNPMKTSKAVDDVLIEKCNRGIIAGQNRELINKKIERINERYPESISKLLAVSPCEIRFE